MRRRKQNSGRVFVKFLIVFAVVALVFGVFLNRSTLFKKKTLGLVDTSNIATTTPATTTSKILNGDIAKWRRFYDKDLGLEFQYPKYFKLTKVDTQVPPDYKNTVKASKLSYSIPVEHCFLSGKCEPTTENMAISLFSVDRDFNTIFSDMRRVYGAELKVITVDGHQGVFVRAGVEGEGAFYYILPEDKAKTLFIARSYIDESVVGGYQKTPDFIKFSDQQAIFDKILGTLSFRPEAI